MRPLALHQLTAAEVSPVELVSIADTVGCQHVCVFAYLPVPNLPFQTVTPEIVPELLSLIAHTGVTVTNIESFPLSEEIDVESFCPALDLGARIGAKRVVTIVFDTVQARAAEKVARLCDLAAERDMDVGLSVEGLTPGCASLETGRDLLRLADRPNLGLGLDCLHLVRTGTTMDEVAALPAEAFAYAQLCDGGDLAVRSDYLPEVFERMVPGEGVFPIAAFLDALPAATPVDIEVPSAILQQNGVPAVERARRAAEASRAALERAQPSR
jgi:sugar phosphate isomerase/epimerase